MPKSGQSWNRQFLADEPLFRVFESFAKDLRTEDWPSRQDYARHLELHRARSSPQLEPLGVAASPERSRRQKRTELNLSELYDGKIALGGQIYCLDQSYHDLFNVIIFSALPRAKRALHTRQFHALQQWLEPEHTRSARLPGRRTREQDALTLFDEGGVVLAVSHAERSRLEGCKAATSVAPFEPSTHRVPILFGHALLEHLYEGHRALRASGLFITLPDSAFQSADPAFFCHRIDDLLAERLENPLEFRTPKADFIFELASDGGLSFRAPELKHPKPATQRRSPQESDEKPLSRA